MEEEGTRERTNTAMVLPHRSSCWEIIKIGRESGSFNSRRVNIKPLAIRGHVKGER
jgi:hypothetical protein